MAYKQNAGGPRQAKTGGGLPGQLHSAGPQQKKKDPVDGGVWDTVKKAGRTAMAVGKTVGNQLADFIQPDANKFGGSGSRESTFNARDEKKRENAAHQDVIDQSNSGKIYGFAGKLAKNHQDTGYSKSDYGSDKEYNDRIKGQVKEHRDWKKRTKK
tara:strand:+ start:224 stop:691 length:468 start_codon:yes stop_codon:yes gene_type:complete